MLNRSFLESVIISVNVYKCCSPYYNSRRHFVRNNYLPNKSTQCSRNRQLNIVFPRNGIQNVSSKPVDNRFGHSNEFGSISIFYIKHSRVKQFLNVTRNKFISVREHADLHRSQNQIISYYIFRFAHKSQTNIC